MNYATSDLKEVLNSTKPGNKQKKAGLGVNAAVNWNVELGRLELQFEFTNQSGENMSNFNVQINKNSFGVNVDGPATKHGITYPAPFETS